MDSEIHYTVDTRAPQTIFTGIAISAAPPTTLTIGPVLFSEEGMTYNGELIKDAGRAYRTIMAVIHGYAPEPADAPIEEQLRREIAKMRSALDTAEAMLEERNTQRHTIFPARTVIIEFTHQHIGDRRMAPELDEAMRQLLAEPDRDQIKTFTASNSVQVTINGLRMLDSEEDARNQPAAAKMRFTDMRGPASHHGSGFAMVMRTGHTEPMEGVSIDTAHGEAG